MNTRDIKWLLVVDDEPDIRAIIADKLEGSLEDLAVKVIQAKDGSEARTKMSFQAFDCIVTDLNMPKIDGAGLIEIAKESQLNSHTPIVIVTGYPEPELTDKHGHTVLLEKPFKSKELVNIVKTQLRLGRTDNRIPAYLLNPFIESIMHVAKSRMNLEPKPSNPVAKAPHTELMGDTICALFVQYGREKSRFAIGFDSGLLESHKAEALAQEIFSITQGVMAKNGPKRLELLGLQIVKKDSSSYRELKSKQGLVIPLETAKGCFYAESLAGVVSSKVDLAA